MAAEDKYNNFNTPESYFNNLADNISANIFIANLKEKNLEIGFTVPNNYFQKLDTKLSALSQTTTTQASKKEASIFNLNHIKYAAAACILMVCGLAIYFNLAKNNLQNQLANLPNHEIELYLQNNTNSTDLPLIIQNVNEIKVEVDKKISTKELNDYLNETI